jgi:hypothetical protein
MSIIWIARRRPLMESTLAISTFLDQYESTNPYANASTCIRPMAIAGAGKFDQHSTAIYRYPTRDDASSLLDAPNKPINLWLFLYNTPNLFSKLNLNTESNLNTDPLTIDTTTMNAPGALPPAP